MEFEDVIRKRKSTRLFSDKEISNEKLDKILEAGRIAPTARNLQAFKVIVIKSEEGIKIVDECSPCRYKAPVVLLVCGDEKKLESTCKVDACIVATHMMLEATNIGVDNIWIEMFDHDKIASKLNLSENLVPVCLLPIGYKSKLCPPSPLHKIRKNIKDLVEYR